MTTDRKVAREADNHGVSSIPGALIHAQLYTACSCHAWQLLLVLQLIITARESAEASDNVLRFRHPSVHCGCGYKTQLVAIMPHIALVCYSCRSQPDRRRGISQNAAVQTSNVHCRCSCKPQLVAIMPDKFLVCYSCQSQPDKVRRYQTNDCNSDISGVTMTLPTEHNL